MGKYPKWLTIPSKHLVSLKLKHAKAENYHRMETSGKEIVSWTASTFVSETFCNFLYFVFEYCFSFFYKKTGDYVLLEMEFLWCLLNLFLGFLFNCVCMPVYKHTQECKQIGLHKFWVSIIKVSVTLCNLRKYLINLMWIRSTTLCIHMGYYIPPKTSPGLQCFKY